MVSNVSDLICTGVIFHWSVHLVCDKVLLHCVVSLDYNRLFLHCIVNLDTVVLYYAPRLWQAVVACQCDLQLLQDLIELQRIIQGTFPSRMSHLETYPTCSHLLYHHIIPTLVVSNLLKLLHCIMKHSMMWWKILLR